MIESKDYILETGSDAPILIDYRGSLTGHEVVVFAHGFKGYKDWGAWNVVADEFQKAGLSFVKFNFSKNGGTLANPIDFPDLNAFGENTYSREQHDLKAVIDWVSQQKPKSIHLIGHSRGGAAVLLQSLNELVNRIVTWAPVTDLWSRVTEQQKDAWERGETYFIQNGRTKQSMPMYPSFWEDLKANREQLNIRNVIEKTNKSILTIHAKDDQAVDFKESSNLKDWNSNVQVHLLESGGHTFDTSHPFSQELLSESMNVVVQETIKFLKK